MRLRSLETRLQVKELGAEALCKLVSALTGFRTRGTASEDGVPTRIHRTTHSVSLVCSVYSDVRSTVSDHNAWTGDQELQLVVNVEAAVLEKPDDDGHGDHGEDDENAV